MNSLFTFCLPRLPPPPPLVCVFAARQMGLDTLLSYMQPRVMDDVRSFLAAVPDTESFEAVQYAGMHVRDVPPRMFGTFKATETLVRERERERERE